MLFEYDVIVVGGGHAGCEAARSAACLGASTLLITLDMHNIAQMSCNPAVGGIAKGQIVREIDALGGMMGIITDRASIQFRMLNRSKGPAMWSPRAQCDRDKFSKLWRQVLENTPGLNIWQGCVNELIIDNDRVGGVRTREGAEFRAKSVVLTNGTFLNGLMHIGRSMIEGGRVAEPAVHGLTEQLVSLGFTAGRMKTGTPVRIDGRSVDWSQTTPQKGDDTVQKFSFLPSVRRECEMRDCYILYTSEKTHAILRSGLSDSPLYNGQIQSVGPRYCPSIETKIVTFADKTEHQLFLEPEGEHTQEYYLNGFSSSLPMDVQINALQTIPALRDVQIYRPGYAIEYDYFDPTQLKATLETKLIHNLYFAGQINGTTGYEEAAGQGLVAGINAALGSQGKEPFTLGRDEAYIGVLIDDLVNKGVDEPYRMFTSRAEYRILLRQDDADMRLTPRGYAIGLATRERFDIMEQKKKIRDEFIDFSRTHSVKPGEINSTLERVGSAPLSQSVKLSDLIARPQLTVEILTEALPELAEYIEKSKAKLGGDKKTSEERTAEAIEAAEILIKYKGYIDRERANVEKLHRLEDVKIPQNFVYSNIQALSTEARQKLERIKPMTIGAASRIPGISPSDINILLLMMKR